MQNKRNLWPLGIILTFALFVPGTIGLIVMSCFHREELVSADYYEQEIRYQKRLDEGRRARALGESVAVTYDAGQRLIRISLPPSHATNESQGTIQLYRPSSAGLDRELRLALGHDGLQTIDAKDLRPGLWKVRVHWTTDNQEYFIDQKLVVGANRS